MPILLFPHSFSVCVLSRYTYPMLFHVVKQPKVKGDAPSKRVVFLLFTLVVIATTFDFANTRQDDTVLLSAKV